MMIMYCTTISDFIKVRKESFSFTVSVIRFDQAVWHCRCITGFYGSACIKFDTIKCFVGAVSTSRIFILICARSCGITLFRLIKTLLEPLYSQNLYICFHKMKFLSYYSVRPDLFITLEAPSQSKSGCKTLYIIYTCSIIYSAML